MTCWLESGVKSGVTCDVTFRRDHDVTHISFHRSGMKADIIGSHGSSGRERERKRDTEKAHKVRSQKGHRTAGIRTTGCTFSGK